MADALLAFYECTNIEQYYNGRLSEKVFFPLCSFSSTQIHTRDTRVGSTNATVVLFRPHWLMKVNPNPKENGSNLIEATWGRRTCWWRKRSGDSISADSAQRSSENKKRIKSVKSFRKRQTQVKVELQNELANRSNCTLAENSKQGDSPTHRHLKNLTMSSFYCISWQLSRSQ